MNLKGMGDGSQVRKLSKLAHVGGQRACEVILPEHSARRPEKNLFTSKCHANEIHIQLCPKSSRAFPY